MILLDTNVISEPLRRSPEARVINWIDAQSLETLYLSAITVAELRFGIASLPVGKQRDELKTSLRKSEMHGLKRKVRRAMERPWIWAYMAWAATLGFFQPERAKKVKGTNTINLTKALT
jgi:predicted nucleic acid-binding protein